MISIEVKTLEGLAGVQRTVKANGGIFATFDEVLRELLKMNPDSEDNLRLRYESNHMVPFGSIEDPGLTVLITPLMGTGKPLIKDSFRIDFVQADKINWKQVEKDNNWIFWYKKSSDI